MGIEKRIEKLEGVWRPQRQPIPNLVMLDETGEPINGHYSEVLRINREAAARGDDVRLSVLRIPAGTKIVYRQHLWHNLVIDTLTS